MEQGIGTWQRVALTLVIIGALNWGLIGLFQFDVVAALFGGPTSGLSRTVYALVGLSALATLPLLLGGGNREGERPRQST